MQQKGFKNSTGTDTSEFAKKTGLASLKLDVDELDIDRLKFVPDDLSKLSNVVNNYVFKKIEYNKLVTRVNTIDTGEFV